MEQEQRIHSREQWLIPKDGNLDEFFGRYISLAAARTPNVLAEVREKFTLQFPSLGVDKTLEEAEKLINEGKKLRGALMTLGFSMAGGEHRFRQDIIDTSLGYEFLHNAFLVHDDIMDRATLRRGKPVAWREFARIATPVLSTSEAHHYGVSHAINLGDMMAFVWAMVLEKRKFPPQRVKEVMGVVSDTVIQTVMGQILDTTPVSRISDLDKTYLLSIPRYKTATYSFVAPFQIGVLLGGKERNDLTLSAIEEFGIPVGVAFQLQDDVLGVYGNEQEIGKSVTSDLTEAKKTLLFWHLYQRLEHDDDRKRFDSLWGYKGVGVRGLEWVRMKGRETGALEYLQGVARGLVAQAKEAIPHISRDSVTQRLLGELADFSIARPY